MRIRSQAAKDAFSRDNAPDEESSAKVPIGSLLALPPADVDLVIRHQQQTGRLFGEVAIELGLVKAEQVERAVQQQQNFTVLQMDDTRVHPLVAAAFNPNSEIARSMRTMRGAISSFRTARGEPLTTLAILGVDAPTEASIVAANLAVTTAQAGRRTLLVDANLNAPVQNGLFFLPNRGGVSTLLSSHQGAEALIRPTAVPLLSVLPAGPAVPNGPELFERGALVEHLHALTDRYEQVIIDASRAAGVEAAVCSGFDAALLVVRRGVTSQVELKGLVASLTAADVPVLGTVFGE